MKLNHSLWPMGAVERIERRRISSSTKDPDPARF